MQASKAEQASKPKLLLIAVPGRFHAFDLARACVALAQPVLVVTCYPALLTRRFTGPGVQIVSAPLLGVLMKLWPKLPRAWDSWFEPWWHKRFGAVVRSAAKRYQPSHCYAFSGIAEELLVDNQASQKPAVVLLARGSAHIETQAALLAGAPSEQPSSWMRARELREYAMASRIHILSSFAERSFLRHGFLPTKLLRLGLGVYPEHFACDAAQWRARAVRRADGSPLRVLFVGNFSRQKGAEIFARIVEASAAESQFRVISQPVNETAAIRARLEGRVEFLPRVPEKALREHYAWADVMLHPAVQDGFAQVLLQAAVAGVYLLASGNSAAPDLVSAGAGGLIVSGEAIDAYQQALQSLAASRELLVDPAQVEAFTQSMVWPSLAKKLLTTWCAGG